MRRFHASLPVSARSMMVRAANEAALPIVGLALAVATAFLAFRIFSQF